MEAQHLLLALTTSAARTSLHAKPRYAIGAGKSVSVLAHLHIRRHQQHLDHVAALVAVHALIGERTCVVTTWPADTAAHVQRGSATIVEKSLSAPCPSPTQLYCVAIAKLATSS